MFHKLESLRRLVKWAIELSEFNIRYKPRAAIKGQVLADFITEFTIAPKLSVEAAQLVPGLPTWKHSVDGAANAQGGSAGLILASLDGIDIEYALRFVFKASNNKAEYANVIVGLNLAHSMEAKQLVIYSNSVTPPKTTLDGITI